MSQYLSPYYVCGNMSLLQVLYVFLFCYLRCSLHTLYLRYSLIKIFLVGLPNRLFGNRSFCYEKMQLYDKALIDADIALSLNPTWIKGLYRKGKALVGLKVQLH